MVAALYDSANTIQSELYMLKGYAHGIDNKAICISLVLLVDHICQNELETGMVVSVWKTRIIVLVWQYKRVQRC